MEEYHIGKEIEKEVRRQYPTIDAFAKALYRERQTVYEIFKRSHIATDRLMDVSRLLNRDFFKEFSNIYNYGETTEKDDETDVSELISQLIPEDNLQVVMAERIPELADEFFLSERKKPLVVIHENASNVAEDMRNVAEGILGKGMVKSITIKPEDIFAFESSITRLSEMPQKAMEIIYTGSGRDGGFDDIILLAERLATASTKHIVVFCSCTNSLGKDTDGNLAYCSWAEECFDTWHKRVHVFVADNKNKDFARRQELYKACNKVGYIDKAFKAFESGDNDTAGRILNDVLSNLSTYQFEVVEIDRGTSRFYARSASPTSEEMALFETCNISPRLTIWFDMFRATGKFIACGEDFGSYVPHFNITRENMFLLMAKGDFK